LEPSSCRPPPKPAMVDCAAGATVSGDVRDVNGAKVSVTSNTFCVCPPTMKWQQNGDTWSCVCPNAGETQVAYALCSCKEGEAVRDGICQPCPKGTIAKYGICACPIVGQKLGVDNVCHCPDGQQPVGNRCVTPCADPTQVLLIDGKCCPPDKVSSCGVCCPPSQRPDVKSGSCVDLAWKATPKATLPNFTPMAPASVPPELR
jgi:hypothetical protein